MTEARQPELQLVLADEAAPGSLLRDWTGDFVVVLEVEGRRRKSLWGQYVFIENIRPWCGWGERQRFLWPPRPEGAFRTERPRRMIFEVVATGLRLEECTAERTRELGEAYIAVFGAGPGWDPEAAETIPATAREV